ncbi:MAG: YlxR family protein [Bacillota bacterium]|nr:YlxR family protein [Bacillota bacterium]
MKKKSIPMRTCLGCGNAFPKKELIRIVKNKDGEISLDDTGKKPGRGAYICKNKECFIKLKKNKRLSREFECAIPDEVYAALEEGLLNL